MGRRQGINLSEYDKFDLPLIAPLLALPSGENLELFNDNNLCHIGLWPNKIERKQLLYL
jgi:hypothetical protein